MSFLKSLIEKHPQQVIAGVVVAVGVGFIAQKFLFPKTKKFTQTNIKVVEINIYPIKGCKGFSTKKWEVGPYGFVYDRNWMIVDENNHFLTQRKYPTMVLIETSLNDKFLTVNAPNMPELKVPIQNNSQNYVEVKVWDDTCTAVTESDEVNAWFTKYFGTNVKLARISDKHKRPYPEKYGLKGDASFADDVPFLVASRESLQDLKDRISKAGSDTDSHSVTMNRFRPNIVFEGQNSPWEEDTWKTIRIGNVDLNVVSSCARCKVPTNDPSTGKMDSQGEPVKTLRTFRSDKNGVYFGQNVIHSNRGTLEVGQSVQVGELKPTQF